MELELLEGVMVDLTTGLAVAKVSVDQLDVMNCGRW